MAKKLGRDFVRSELKRRETVRAKAAAKSPEPVRSPQPPTAPKPNSNPTSVPINSSAGADNARVVERPRGMYWLGHGKHGDEKPLKGEYDAATKTNRRYGSKDEAAAALPAAARKHDEETERSKAVWEAGAAAREAKRQRAEEEELAARKAAERESAAARKAADTAAARELAEERNRPTTAQVNYATKLLVRRIQSGAEGGHWSNLPKPEQIGGMNRKGVSDLISYLRDEDGPLSRTSHYGRRGRR